MATRAGVNRPSLLVLFTLVRYPLASSFLRRHGDIEIHREDLPASGIELAAGLEQSLRASCIEREAYEQSLPAYRSGAFMPIRSEDLHGFVPDTSGTALLLIDVINDFEFDDGEQLLKLAIPVGHKIAELKSRARAANVPSIYVNDNFGKWQSDFRKIVDHCRSVRGKPFVELLLPDEDDYFVLKPKHSGFYSTSLGLLLNHLTATNLILTGIAGNNCVLFTANDAYMRDYKLFIPSDCVVSNTEEENAYALKQMKEILKATVLPASDLDLDKLTSSTSKNSAEAS